MSRATLYLCTMCDVAMSAARCWNCGNYRGLSRISVDIPSTAWTTLHRLPRAEPYNLTVNTLRIVAALQVEDDLRMKYDARSMAMPLLLAVGPDGQLMRVPS